MIPTYISTLILHPGHLMEAAPNQGIPSIGEGFAHLDDEALGGFIYAPEREEGKRLIKLDDIKVVDGKLAELLFAVTGCISIQTGSARHGWADHSMSGGDWVNIRDAMEGLYEIAKQNLTNHIRENAEWRGEYHADTVDFVGLWSAVFSSGDWEHGGLPELDGFDFEGQGMVVSFDKLADLGEIHHDMPTKGDD